MMNENCFSLRANNYLGNGIIPSTCRMLYFVFRLPFSEYIPANIN